MKHELLLDYELTPARDAYVVRTLIKLAGDAPGAGARTPLNLSLVLDRSGSMSGAKLAAAREAATFLVQRLAIEDIVSVVVFDDRVDTVAMPATGQQQHGLLRAIGRIVEGGSTNLSGGWLRGRELTGTMKREGALNRVILMTDGHANQGIVDADALAGMCREARANGITTTTIGFGRDYDERLLQAMADAGGGSTFYIERPDQAVGVFEEEIEGLLSVSAQNVAIEIAPANAVQLVTIHHDYPMTEVGNGRKRVEIGDLYAREPRSLLVEFLVPVADARASVPIATITIHAHVLTADGAVERREIVFPVAGTLEAQGHHEPEIHREILLSHAAAARREARERQDRGDWEGAAETLRRVAQEIAISPDKTEQLDEQVEDLRMMADGMRYADPADLKYMGQRAYNLARGKHVYEQKLMRPKPPRRNS